MPDRRAATDGCHAQWPATSIMGTCMCGIADAMHTDDHVCRYCSSTCTNGEEGVRGH